MSDQVTVLPQQTEGKAYALLCAVEDYIGSGIGRVDYAERDATAIRDSLLNLGYEADNIDLIVNSSASVGSIRYLAKQLAGTVEEGDSVFLFFAGHGYTWQGKNYLMCHDTRLDDIEDTAIPLQSLFNLFAKSGCKQVMFFLDCCHSGLHLGDDSRGVLEDFSADELRDYFRDADFCVVFSACDKGEKSYPSRQFQHGYCDLSPASLAWGGGGRPPRRWRSPSLNKPTRLFACRSPQTTCPAEHRSTPPEPENVWRCVWHVCCGRR